MTTFNINDKYSATYTPFKVERGWRADGEIWKHEKDRQYPTGIKFAVKGTTEVNARKNAEREASRVCPRE